MAGAPYGNQNRCALVDPTIRQKAYAEFCAHLALGKSVKSWWYEDEKGYRCTWETMLTYIKNNPIEFDSVSKQIAHIKGFNVWEDVAEKSAKGKNKANTASLQMVMRNKFGWDKEDKSKDVPSNDDINDVKHQLMLAQAEISALKAKNA